MTDSIPVSFVRLSTASAFLCQSYFLFSSLFLGSVVTTLFSRPPYIIKCCLASVVCVLLASRFGEVWAGSYFPVCGTVGLDPGWRLIARSCHATHSSSLEKKKKNLFFLSLSYWARRQKDILQTPDESLFILGSLQTPQIKKWCASLFLSFLRILKGPFMVILFSDRVCTAKC